MIILLRHVAFFLLKKLFLCCVRLRRSRKLIFAGVITTVAGTLLHLWFLSWHVTVSSYNSLNGSRQLSETLNEARIDKFQLFPASSVISLNSSVEVIHSVPIKGTRAGGSNVKRSKIDNELKIIASSPPPKRIPTSSLQRYIWTLSPSEALMFAKKEIKHAPIITEDPELYAALFHNVSVFKRVGNYEQIFPLPVDQPSSKMHHIGAMTSIVPNILCIYKIAEVAPYDDKIGKVILICSACAKNPVDAMIHCRNPILRKTPMYTRRIEQKSQLLRSYELMEMTLKIHIYRDGKRPVFHVPQLKGIYASEGWFMKLMEENKQFVTRDPEKAHLFYLPYSVRQLEMALYVPNSHNMRPLANFLRDYVNRIAAKYPFWNRTHGSDHFFVACHDWGPYTTTAHGELKENTIKVLCNADLSEGIFVAGTDVSLPQATIRTPRRPHRYIGSGNRVSQRPILAFFAGYMHGRVRPILLKYWNKDEDMKIHRRLPVHVSRKMSYIQHMKSSKYCICPMGYEVNSPRIVEAIYYECVPVIIADNFVLPLSEVLDWSSFSVVIAEKDIPKLKEILLAIPLRKYRKMQLNVKMVQKHFLWHPVPIKYDLFHMILHSIWFNRLKKIQDPHS